MCVPSAILEHFTTAGNVTVSHMRTLAEIIEVYVCDIWSYLSPSFAV